MEKADEITMNFFFGKSVYSIFFQMSKHHSWGATKN